MMSIARLSAPEDKRELFKAIKKMQIFSFENCSDEDKATYADRLSNIEIENYNFTVADTIDIENRVRILAKEENDKTISEIIIATLGRETHTLIYMEGKLSMDMIIAMSQENPTVP